MTAPPSATTQPRRRFLGIDYTPLGLDEAIAACAARPAEAPFAAVVTPNADHVQRLHRADQAADRAAYGGAWLCLNDSRIVGALARLRGVALPTCPGADLTARLFTDGVVRPEDPITVIGLPAETIQTLKDRFGLSCVTHHNPPMGFDRDPQAVAACVRVVVETPARFVFLAVGSPRQERLAEAIAATGRARGLGLCIGASLEFLTGAKARAPEWMRRRGLEWLHRLATEPRRLWRRYLVDSPRVFWVFLRTEVLAPGAAPPSDRP